METKKKSSGCGGCTHPISASVGELIIQVRRNSFNIHETLPYCIWGSIYAETNYGVILQPYLPTGVTVSNTNSNGTVVFTYTKGILTDTITVGVTPLSPISYGEVLSNLKNNYMESCFMVYNCNSENNAPNFDNNNIFDLQSGGLFLITVGADGNKSVEVIVPNTRRQINNSVTNMIELYLRKAPIKPDTVWVHQFVYFSLGGGDPPPVTPPIENTFTVFFSDRVDLNLERFGNIPGLKKAL